MGMRRAVLLMASMGLAVLLASGVAFAAPGDLDPSFGTGGKVVTDLGSPNGSADGAQDVALAPDGRIVAAGLTGLARYNADGSLDDTFGDGGKLVTAPGIRARGVALQPDGKILLAGQAGGATDPDTGATDHDFALARYTSDGSIDPTFGTNGVATTSFSDGPLEDAFDLAVQPDGKIVAAGSANFNFAMARYNANGTLDDTFSGDGKVTTASFDRLQAHAIALQSNGKILLAGAVGRANSDFFLVRYNSDGSEDVSFNGNGRVTTAFGAYRSERILDLAIQRDGKLVAVGGAYDGLVAGGARMPFGRRGLAEVLREAS
jgi:uncharacterized delta-60 repeat protein